MIKKCDAKCDAKNGAFPLYLWLRNDIFYYRMELPKVNGKRRYRRISLHTGNFYEAREILRYMNTQKADFERLKALYDGLFFETVVDSPASSAGFATKVKRLSRKNKSKDIKELYTLYNQLRAENQELIETQHKILSAIEAIEPLIKSFLGPVDTALCHIRTSKEKPVVQQPKHTIKEIIKAMLLKANTKKDTARRKENTLIKLLNVVGLSVNDDYSKFHDIQVIQQLTEHILNQDVKNEAKKGRLSYIKELVTCASNVEPDFYKLNVVANLPTIKKTRKAEKNPHLPYTEEQLLKIFNPKHDFFKKNPDYFWTCMIALFTGARINAALTLQFDDVFIKNNIPVIQFIQNNDIKQLKNSASERVVPIHNQLIELGFVDYVNRQKEKRKATGTDFINPKAITKGGQYNNKYVNRGLSVFLKKINIKSAEHDGYDFHSFRKTASITMQDAKIPNSYINDIIGWEGEGTMEQSYSNHTLDQIKAQLDTFEYGFLKPHFEKWKAIMAKK